MWTCQNCGGQTDDEFKVCWTCRTPKDGTSPEQDVLLRVLVTTTPTLQSHNITQYFGPVFGETILGANAIRDLFASITDIIGGRSTQYEQVLTRGRNIAIREIAERTERMGGNAVVGMSVTYESVGDTMLMVCATGTAVLATPNASDV